ALPNAALGPFLSQAGDIERKDGDVADAAPLLVDVAADGFGPEGAGEAGFFPRFLQGGLARRLAGFDETLRDDPTFAVARVDKAHAAIAEREGRCLSNVRIGIRHQWPRARGGGSWLDPRAAQSGRFVALRTSLLSPAGAHGEAPIP